MNKKAAISIPVRWIIIIVIALVVLILILSFIRTLSREADIRLEEGLGKYAMPPTAVISSPSPVETYTVFQKITFDGSKSYDKYYKIVGYFWDIDSNSIIDSRGAVYNDYYWEPGEYNVTLKVVNDAGAIGTGSEIVRVVTNNKKKSNLKDSLFLIRDNDRANEKTILRLIPVTTWYDADGFHSIPYYVYYVNESGNTLDQSQLEERMDKYDKKHAYIFDDNKMSDNHCSGLDHCVHSWDSYTIDIYREGKLDKIYFDFWSLYEYVVLVNTNETKASLIASLFAAFYNSPLIFVNQSNLDKYKGNITNYERGPTQRIYYVPSIESIDSVVDGWVTLFWDRQPYSEYELRKGNVNRIIKLTSNVTMER